MRTTPTTGGLRAPISSNTLWQAKDGDETGEEGLYTREESTNLSWMRCSQAGHDASLDLGLEGPDQQMFHLGLLFSA